MFNPKQPEFWVLIAFVAFIALLGYYRVHSLIGKALDDRADGIRRELDQARRLREEAQQLLADYQRKAREAEDEAKAIVEAARREAEALAATTRTNLKDSLERRTRLAEDKIARAEAQAVADVRASAIDAATTAAERILQADVGRGSDTRLIDESIRGLKSRLN